MLPVSLDDYNNEVLIGIDEAGRGPLCGCVAAVCVIWDPNFEPKTKEETKLLNMIKDSKKLSAKNREKLSVFIKNNAVEYAIGTVDNIEIDKINILQATFKAMHLALDQIKTPFDRIIVDGDKFKPYIDLKGDFIPHMCIKGGDNKLLQIAAASIIAKVHRDQLITDLHNSDEKLQCYGWDKNKGYGTKIHMEALRKYGPSAYHRRTFVHL